MEQIIADLKLYIEAISDSVSDADNEDGVSDNVLSLLVRKAIESVCKVRYGNEYTDTERQKAIEQFEDVIFDLALYRYTKMGAEFESSHESNGTKVNYNSESHILKRIVPLAKIY